MEMNYRNTLALIAAMLLLSLSPAASANTLTDQSGSSGPIVQGPGGGQRRGGMERDDLNITADQKAKLESIRQNEREQIQAMRSDSSLSIQDKEAKIRSMQESARKQAMSVLTPEQQQKLENVRKNHRFS